MGRIIGLTPCRFSNEENFELVIDIKVLPQDYC